MKYIEKKEIEPLEFTIWKSDNKETIEHYFQSDGSGVSKAWEFLPSNLPDNPEDNITYYSKYQLKETLLAEQGFICAYCMAEQKNDHDCTIDHLVPKARNPVKNTFDYQNLLAVCDGSARKSQYEKPIKEELRHCNNKKGEGIIGINPLQKQCEQRFVFDESGNIYPKDENDLEAIQTIDQIGLNSRILIRKRKQAIEQVLYKPDSDHPGKSLNNRIDITEVKIELTGILVRKNNRFKPFCIAIKQILERIISEIHN